ncbi:recombinase RecT [Brassicibacter mesophilus]|uniref:recombinase RecT n=1 Tax=Brassicibacter mesophilus TaxID=745119 RepID=UPI003D229734
MAENQLTVIHSNLQKLLDNKSEALPKGFNQTRFLQNCMTVLQDTKGIDKVEPITVARTMLKGAFLGLDFFNRECYAIPYGNQLNFQTDYKGEIKLAKKYSINPIKDIYAKLVREGDEFQEEIKDGKQTITFKPKMFNNGTILGAFAVALFKDGSMMYETMSVEEMEHVRKTFSKQSSGKAWTDSTGEMYKKTVLRRLCKLIELDFDSIEQKQAFEEGSGFEFKDNKEKSEIKRSSLEEEFEQVVDVDYEVVKEGEQIEIGQ